MKTKQFILIAFLSVCLTTITATPFTPGNIVVTRVGTGSVLTTGDKVFLDEYTKFGKFVQTIALPTDFLGPQAVETCLSAISGDGQYLTLSGLSTASGVSTTVDALTAPRSIAVVKYDGTVNVLTPTLRLPASTATANLVANTPIIALTSGGSGFAVGQYVYGYNIPLNAKVASIEGANITLTVPIVSALSAVSIYTMTEPTPIYANYSAPKGVYTTNGKDFWLGSSETNIQYYNPDINDGLPVNIAGVDARYLTSINNILWKTVKYGTRVGSLGTDLDAYPKTPETTVVAVMPLKNIGDSISQDPMQITAVNVNATEAGDDVMYVAEYAFRGKLNGLKKYSKVNNIWQYNGGYGLLTENYSGVCAKVTNPTSGEVTLYVVRKVAWYTAGSSGNYRYRGGELVKLIDAGGYNSPINIVKDSICQLSNTISEGVPVALNGMWRSVSFVPEQKAPNAIANTFEQTMNIYPTFVMDELNVVMAAKNQNSNIKIISIDGKVVFSKPISSGVLIERLNVSNLERGVYFVQVENQLVRKFIKN